MPSVKNPGLLTPRAGQVPAKTVPSAGLIQPNRDVEPLKAHLQDPSRAHMASAIGIVDAGGFFESDEVEGALQEVGTTGDYTRQSGVVVGSTTSVVGLNLVVAANSYILLRGNVRAIAGLTATVPVLAGTYYAYIDWNLTLQISISIPSITNNNTVLLNKVVTDGLGGVVLSDARFFVARLDRKPDLTLRSGTSSGDNAAEACFVTTEAALFWLGNITQDVKKTLLIRGVLVLTDEIRLPTGGVTIRGEGDAIIRTSLSVNKAIDLNGQDDIIIENLTFESNGAALMRYAIYDATGASNLIIRNCAFNPLGSTWNGGAIYLSGTSYTDVTIERCSGTVEGHGIIVDQPIGTLTIRDCDFTGTAPLASSRYGYWIAKGAVSQYLSFSLENCKATAFAYGLYSFGATVLGEGSVKNCKFLGVVGGVSCFDRFVIEACEIRLDSTDGLYGVICGDGTVVRNCTIATTRAPATYTTDHAAGVFAYSRCVVDGCYISGFRTTANYRADGVLILPSSGDQSYNKVVNNHFVDSAVYAFSDPSDPQNGLTVQGNTFESTATTSLPYGAISANGQSNLIISDNVIRCNTTTTSFGGFSYGVEIKSGSLTLVGFPYDVGYSFNAIVKNNVITSPRYSGVYVYGFASQVDISGNTIDGFVSANPKEPSAYGVRFSANTTAGSTGTGICRESSISSNRLTRLYSGIYLNGTAIYKAKAVKIADNAVSYCAYIGSAGAYNALDFTDSGSKGIGVEYATDISITDNNVSNIGVMLLDDGSTSPPSNNNVASNGIYIWNTYPAQVEGNVVTGLNATSGGQSHGINAVVISGAGVLGERDIRIANNTLELLQAPLVSGTATAGANDTLTDGTKTWTVNAYTSCVVTITSGTGSGQTRYIDSNTANILTVNPNWGTPPDGTSVYEILQSEVNGAAAIRHIQRQLLGVSEFSGLQVEGNRIYTHESTSAQEPFAYGIWLDGDNSTLGATYLDTRICNNMIHGWSDAANRAGILVVGDSAGALNLRAVSIDGNTLVASKLGAASNNAAISLICYNGTIRDCSVSGNIINGESDTLVARAALYFDLDGTGIESLKVDSNVLIGERGALITQFTGTTVNFKGLSFCGNRIRGDKGVDMIISGNLYDCKFDGNSGMGFSTFDGIDVGIYLSCNEFYNVSISHNDLILRDTSDSLGIWFASNVKSLLMSNLKIDGNTIRQKKVSGGSLRGRGIDVSIDGNLSGLSICNNNVDFYLDGNSYARCGIRVYTDTDTPVAWRGVNVSGNVIRGIFRSTASYPEGGALVFDTQKNDAATDYALLYNAAFIGNRGLGQPYDQSTFFTAYGFYLRLTGTSTSGSAVSVTNNAFIQFVDTGVGTCAQFVGTVPANSICQSNISEDGSYVISDSGTADAGSSTYTVVDAAKTWTVNEHAGRYVKLISGTGVPQFCRITSNTPTVLTVSPGWIVPPGAATDYEIRRYNGFSGFGTGAASGFSPELIPDFNVNY